MFKLFNSLGKKIESFQPVNPNVVTLFTCGPSVYQRAHIGNFRTFLFEDILVRYLEYSGYPVKRGMNFTDVEDKAIQEARARNVSIKELTDGNIDSFVREMKLLRMKIPDYLVRASESIDQSVEIIEQLLSLQIAYWYRGNVYFDPLKFDRFGALYGLDMAKWPAKKRRFHKDTYPGMNWNLGDFILWHGCKKKDETCWDTRIGRGRPSWNIQDPSMVSKHFNETLSIYCGGFDNLFRHHDYSIAILESIRPYPMARFWLHCHHLVVNGQKMSKSKGNIYYTDTLLGQGYDRAQIRFFLIYGHYRKNLNYSDQAIRLAAEKLNLFKERLKTLEHRAGQNLGARIDENAVAKIKEIFVGRMDDDLDVKGAFDAVHDFLNTLNMKDLTPSVASGYLQALKGVDQVLQVLFLGN
jgi:cysteinyl-tRNA synthetase